MNERYWERHAWWTQERTDTLRLMWEKGDSATIIADCLGAGATRNAVIGKVHRLALGPHPKRIVRAVAVSASPQLTKVTMAPPALQKIMVAPSTDENVRQGPSGNAYKGSGRVMARFFGPAIAAGAKRAATVSAAPAVKPEGMILVSEELFIPAEIRLSLMQLNDSVCKWPIGDPCQPGFYFCGYQSEAHMSYCKYHRNKAYDRFPKRRRNMAA